ncbi:MAG: response regulator, partial [Gemmataceae bacterium]|nr:response regulator [Gemmataceae bacterium]
RTPMNGILGMTELALRADPTPEQRRYLSAVKLSGEQLLRVINDILDFSKIEAGKLDFESIDFPLRDTLAALMRTLALRAHEKGLELVYHVPQDVPDGLVGDPVRLRQVLVNLMGNAIKFTARGEVAVYVRTETATGEEVRLQFAVRDTGVGIPAEKQQLIFQPFTQADGSTTRKYGGTGLGLTISSRLVEAMGGQLGVDSIPGEGSTFRFTARFGRSQAPVAASPPAPPVALRDRPVLVVDDNATNRFILQELLTGWYLRPTVVDSGATALAALTAADAFGRPFALILLDCQMPEMDGFTLTERIRQRDTKVPIMMLTSADQSGDSARCRALGILSHLVKPVSPSELLEAIARALQCTPPGEQCTPPPTVPAPPSGIPVLRVLLAEDNAVNQVVAAEMLKQLGHEVVVASNGKEALETLARQPCDLVFMDVQMPEMDGFEATAALRAQEQQTGQHIPVIAMTAHAMKGDRERCLEAGMDSYVAKPIQPAGLRQAITDVLPLLAPRTNGKPHDSAPEEGTRGAEAAVPVLDRADVLTRVNHNKQILRQIIGLFREDCPQLLAAVRAALERGQAGELARAAHTLKGAVGNLGATVAFQAALELETLGYGGDLSGARAALARLEGELGRFHEALAHWDREDYA